MTMNYFWIILLFTAAAASASPACNEDALGKCNELRTRDELDIAFPRDADELREHCTSEKPALFCYADFVERCPGSVTTVVREFYTESKKLFNRICEEDSDLQAKYLRNAKCLNDVMTTQMEYCVHKHTQKEGTCTYQGLVIQCLGSQIMESCGQEGYFIMKEVYRVMKPMLEQGIC